MNLPTSGAGVWPQHFQDEYNAAMQRISGAQYTANAQNVAATNGQSTNPTDMAKQIQDRVMPTWYDRNSGKVNYEALFDQYLPNWRTTFPQLQDWITRTVGGHYNAGVTSTQTANTNTSATAPVQQPRPQQPHPTQQPSPYTPPATTPTSAPVYNNSEAYIQPIAPPPTDWNQYSVPTPHYDTNEYVWNPQSLEEQIKQLMQW
jgi:hypothetical protein